MDKMITTSNTDLKPLEKDGVKEKLLEDGTVVLVSSNPLKTLSTSRLKLKTRIEGKEEIKNYYPPLTTTLMNRFSKTVKGKKARDRFMEQEADKKRVAEGVEPVLKGGKKKTK